MITSEEKKKKKKKKNNSNNKNKQQNKTTTTIGLIRELSFSQGKKAGNADRTPMFTKAEWLSVKSTNLTIFVATFF